MSKINLKMLLYSEDEREDRKAIENAYDLNDGVNLQLICVDSIEDLTFELNDKLFNIVIIGDPLINVTTIEVIQVLEKRQQKIPHMVLVGSFDDFSAIAILDKTATLQEVTKTTLATMMLMTYQEIEKASIKEDNRLKLARGVNDMMEAWGQSLERRDKGTAGHTERVTKLTVKLARKIGMPKLDIVNIRQGALLHDIGKIGIPDEILLKEGSLSDEEWVVMKMHPVFAYDMLAHVATLRDALDIPYCHHEKWDGTGYPRGLAGQDIPMSARIFSVCDAYDALTSDRPYRLAWTKAATLAHIESLSGIAFDPRVVMSFLQMMGLAI